MYLIHRALAHRRDNQDLFADGAYIPLQGAGRGRDHLCAFVRRKGHRAVIVAVPRLIVGLTEGARIPPTGEKVWADTRLVLPADGAGQSYRDVFTGATLRSAPLGEGAFGLEMASVLADFPVAMLERIE